MKKGLIYLGVAIIVASLVVEVHHDLSHRAEVRTLSSLCENFLSAEARLPAPVAVNMLQRITVHGTQASLLSRWLKQQDQTAMKTVGLTPVKASATLSDVTLSGTDPMILSAEFSVHRQFVPSGQNTETGLVSFWIIPGRSPVIEAVSFNTDPIQTSSTPDSINLNLWNLVPAAPLPHGQ